MINFSIIIPHYNIPNLLIRCLKTIPIREDIQVIVVDDCSPDFDTYKGRFPDLSRPYLELYQTSKGGSAGRARNIGVQHAKGKWLIFMDADDMFSESAETILDQSVNREEDILFYNSYSVKSDNLSEISERNIYASYFIQYEIDKNEYPFRYRFHSLWGKIIKKELIDKHSIQFSETQYSNDVYFSIVAGYYAKTIKVDNRVLYVVTERQGSLASSQFVHQKPSLKECDIRLKEAIRARMFIEGKGIKKFDIQYNNCMSIIRRNYPFHYIVYLLMHSIIHPSYVQVLYKRDLEYILKRI